MFEILSDFLKKNHEYELKDYAVYEMKEEPSNLPKITTGIFVIFLALFVLDLTGVWENFMNLVFVIILFVVLVILPFMSKRPNPYRAIIVTPKFLIERMEKDEFTVIEFDEITAYQVTGDGVCVRQKRNQITLGAPLFREEIESVCQILEAKGKTFDPKKDFMVRPIRIVIEDNKVMIEDIEEETETEILYKEYNVDYEYLTPGFINEIIFRNATVDSASFEGDNLTLKMDGLEVKGGHPENTTFDSIMAKDCVVIFENVKISKLILKNLNDKNEPDEKLDKNLEEFTIFLQKAVVSEWRATKGKMEMNFATGVNMLVSAFTYEEVIIGWNEFK